MIVFAIPECHSDTGPQGDLTEGVSPRGLNEEIQGSSTERLVWPMISVRLGTVVECGRRRKM